MSIPKTDQFPDDPDNLSPARRRRARRGLIPEDLVEIAENIERLAYQTIPTFDFFLFSLLSAAIITVSILVDSPVLLVLGALTAPVMAPFIGIALGTATGSLRFFSQRLVGSLVASGFVFLVGILGGYATFVFNTPELQFLIYNARLSWTHIVLLLSGTIFSILAFKKDGRIPVLPSLAIAYELYVPLALAGFGFGSGQPHLWPDSLVLFGIHLAVLAISGTIVFLVAGIKPLKFIGYTFGTLVIIVCIVALIGFSSAGAVFTGRFALPTPLPSATPTFTPAPPSQTPTKTPIPPSPTLTPTVPTATNTPLPSTTNTITPKPTPLYAEIAVTGGYGAYVRSEPQFGDNVLQSLINGTVVEILDPSPTFDEESQYNWLNIRFINEDGDPQDGWIVARLLLVSTPQPEW
jgi:hypothetical protein